MFSFFLICFPFSFAQEPPSPPEESEDTSKEEEASDPKEENTSAPTENEETTPAVEQAQEPPPKETDAGSNTQSGSEESTEESSVSPPEEAPAKPRPPLPDTSTPLMGVEVLLLDGKRYEKFASIEEVMQWEQGDGIHLLIKEKWVWIEGNTIESVKESEIEPETPARAQRKRSNRRKVSKIFDIPDAGSGFDFENYSANSNLTVPTAYPIEPGSLATYEKELIYSIVELGVVRNLSVRVGFFTWSPLMLNNIGLRYSHRIKQDLFVSVGADAVLGGMDEFGFLTGLVHVGATLGTPDKNLTVQTMYITEDNYLNTSLAGMMRLHKAWVLVGEVHVLFDIDFYDSGLYSLGAVRYMHISNREQWAVDVGVFQPSEYLGISSDISVLPWLGINRYF